MVKAADLKNVDMHFVRADQGSYPINFLRNVALDNCRTDFVVLLDVDFKPNHAMYSNLQYAFYFKFNLPISRKFLDVYGEQAEHKVWAIAAFEVDVPEYPEKQANMLAMVDKDIARQIRILL